MKGEPLLVHCGKCQHEWALGFLPMPADKVGSLLHGKCPACGSKQVLLGEVARPTNEGDYEAWWHSGDTGISSRTIWRVMTGRGPITSDVFGNAPPQDPSDFGRCYRLLEVMPSWRARLSEVSAKYPRWAPLVQAWDELTALYEEEVPNHTGSAPKLYRRMDQLLTEVVK